MKRLILWAPLVVFLVFLAFFARGLMQPESRTIRSQLVGQSLPDFVLQPALPTLPGLSLGDFRDGKPRLLNVFASWCVPCAAEAPQLLQLAKAGVPIEAVAIRDRPEDIKRFLDRHGNPYTRIGADPTSGFQIAIGSSGVPETFVIDGKGIIRYQHVGDIRPEHVSLLLEQVEAAK